MENKFDYDAELLKAKAIAQTLQQEIEAKVLGKKRDALYLSEFGEFGETRAVAVKPGGDIFSYQITSPYAWLVSMQETDSQRQYECGICDLMDASEVRDLFEQRFSEVDTKALTRAYFKRHTPKSAD